MKASRNRLMAALCACGVAFAGLAAAEPGRHEGGGHGSRDGRWGGEHRAHWRGGDRDGGDRDGGRWRRAGWRWGIYLGSPFWAYPYGDPGGYAYSWSYPYPYGYYYPPRYSYPYSRDYYYANPPAAYVPVRPREADLGPAPRVAPGPGAPTQAPLYRNYCPSAQAYYPKVAQCPEGWKFIEPAR